ncbi:hypothetical protein ACHAPT_009867 [Fusarium lateritium]
MGGAFFPYFIALLFLEIPTLILEVAIGQAYRGSVVVAFHGINKHLKGLGLAVSVTGFVVATYYVPILAWVMYYFRTSFHSPLPWKDRGMDFFMKDVIANVDPVIPESGYIEYPGTALIGETVGWCAFIWFTVWLCMFKGVGTTGRAVYFTMGLPVIMLIGNQLRRDLNVVVATGKNWNIPALWPVVLRYVSAPILAIVVSFANLAFAKKSNDLLRHAPHHLRLHRASLARRLYPSREDAPQQDFSCAPCGSCSFGDGAE